MNGPEHYREAERLLAETEGSIREAVAAGSPVHLEVAQEIAPVSLAAAQVHATLALAAATAEEHAEKWSGHHLGRSWSEAIS